MSNLDFAVQHKDGGTNHLSAAELGELVTDPGSWVRYLAMLMGGQTARMIAKSEDGIEHELLVRLA